MEEDLIDNEDNNDEEDTDDEEMIYHANMVRQVVPIDAPSDVIDVRAHFEYGDNDCFKDKMYAILDGGADSCILGKMAKVIDYTGGHANLVGYDPKTTRTMGVPIVTAIIKARSNVPGQVPILLKLNQAPINKNSPITLISEYQVREYRLIIDSVAKKHWSGNGTYGTQLFQVSADVHIKFEDKGGLMGFEILPIEPEDEETCDTFTITCPDKWRPS